MNRNKFKLFPFKLIILLGILLAFPVLIFHYFRIDFNEIAKLLISHPHLTQAITVDLLDDYVNKTILLWITLCLGSITLSLNLIQYCLADDKQSLMIGFAQIPVTMYFLIFPANFYNDPVDFAYILKLILFISPFSAFMLHTFAHYTLIASFKKKVQTERENLQYIATHDSLTGLYNRRSFEELLKTTFNQHARNLDYFALLIIDIDNFKLVNDSFGHQYGDNLLKLFADKMMQIIRQGDIFARIGGDEFALITSKLQSPASAELLANRILNELQEEHISISIGIATYPLQGETVSDLIKNADLAMYNAKKAGKNTYRVYSNPIHASIAQYNV